MRCIRVLSFTVIAANFFACDELPILGTEMLHKLNLPIGRSWVYVDSVVVSGADSAIFVRQVVVTATKRGSMIPELQNLLCLEITVREGDSLSHAAIWYRHDDSGLWEVAYQNEEIVFAFPRVGAYSDLIHEIDFAHQNLLGATKRNAAGLQEIKFRDEPRLVLKYPVQTGLEWIAFKNPFQRTLRCDQYASVSVPAGDFLTFRIQGKGDLNPAINFIMYDYFCVDGLIRRELHWRDLEAYTPSGHPRAERFNIDETIVLVDIVG